MIIVVCGRAKLHVYRAFFVYAQKTQTGSVVSGRLDPYTQALERRRRLERISTLSRQSRTPASQAALRVYVSPEKLASDWLMLRAVPMMTCRAEDLTGIFSSDRYTATPDQVAHFVEKHAPIRPITNLRTFMNTRPCSPAATISWSS